MKNYLRKYLSWFIIVFFIIIAGILVPSFGQISNLLNITRQASMIVFCAIGMSMVMLIGDIDLSTGGVMAICAMMASQMMLSGINEIVAILAAIITGAVIGLFSGVLVSKVNIPGFIATYVVGKIAEGVALWISKGHSVGGVSKGMIEYGFGKLLGIPWLTWTTLVGIIVFCFMMRYTRLGKHIYALGGNEITVKQEGINADRLKCLSFMLAGLCSGIAGIMLCAYLNTAASNMGTTYQLDAVAAAVVGGVSLQGGVGKIQGAVAGALLIGALRNFINIIGLHPYIQNLIVGGIIIGIVAIGAIRNRVQHADAKVF